MKLTLCSCVAALGLGLAFTSAPAKVPPEQVAQLDGDKLTCMGAERAGTASGVAAYTGKWLGPWPGIKSVTGYDPGPYTDEKPLFTITAANMGDYDDKLTEGQKALLKKYPQTFRMPVYVSHRDFRFPDWVCETVKKNAAAAELVHNGLGNTGTTGAIAFPFPKNGQEAIWNIIYPYRPWNDSATDDIADVYSNGSVTWGKQRFMTLSLSNDPHHRGSNQDPVNSYFYNRSILPVRENGQTGVGFTPNDFSDNRIQAWQYNPGTRRVRQAPDVGFDYPVPPSGLRTVDDDYLFNGSPERYEWKLIGKQEIYIPYNDFRINDPAVKYKDLLNANTINPDYMRYELHRVWVVEGTLKSGYRHIYARRVLYADEDSWLAHWADNYDSRGQLWRTAFVAYRYAPDAQAFHRGVSVYHDVIAGAFEAGYMVNEAGDGWWKLNQPMSPKLFSPEAAAQGGH
jgi:hypothetical protein